VWVDEGESAEKAMARWLAERPGQDPARDGRQVIFIGWETAASAGAQQETINPETELNGAKPWVN
jgi:ADP-ribose pyrophosphatase YjhB (NUDIX family)